VEHLDRDLVWERLPMVAAIDALEHAIGGQGIPDGPARMHLEVDGQLLLVMPAMAHGWAGSKLVTIDPTNPSRGASTINGLYTLFGPPSLEPVAVIDGRALTGLRTAAVSALATRHLARPDAGRLVIFGAGAQGRAHLLGMAAVRTLTDVRIVAPRAEAVAAFVAFAADHGIEVTAGRPEDVREADLVCACTSSHTPVFDGSTLPAGVHVNAIGAYQPDMQEVDAATVAGSRVVVETRDAALVEKGDLLLAEAAGAWQREAIVADLTELLRDGRPGRREASDRTLFSSVGLAYEDLVIARALVDRSTEPVVGR
jgi:ornithine cyclodeaminase/alanine dehydrogenase-like protein (mu-crystallin family)